MGIGTKMTTVQASEVVTPAIRLVNMMGTLMMMLQVKPVKPIATLMAVVVCKAELSIYNVQQA